jgi:hypothetical protein
MDALSAVYVLSMPANAGDLDGQRRTVRVQNDRSRTVTARLRSDVLLLKQEDAGEWVSFRDVFEVDGRPVRDRDDRLRKLFLEPGPDATAQLLRIKEESARHNIGPLRRNINVPLYLFKFLSPAARPRLRFMIGARQESGGLRTWRVDFTEVVRPTIIHGINEEDLPASGHFLLEQSTGAIVETLLHLQTGAFVADIRVRFRIDPGLGLWVPAEMKEAYSAPGGPEGDSGLNAKDPALEGTARYSNFRRFQVKTDVNITIPK